LWPLIDIAMTEGRRVPVLLPKHVVVAFPCAAEVITKISAFGIASDEGSSERIR